jgi:monoamine oxidase
VLPNLDTTERPSEERGATFDRRKFIVGSGAVVGGAALSLAVPSVAGASGGNGGNGHSGSPKPRIAIIGGGIAGMTAALELSDYGFPSTVYEASNRIGGRMHSDTTSWANGQVSEHCGELIDSAHLAILGLANRFRIPFVDLLAAQPAGSTDTYYVDGGYYPVANVYADFAQIANRVTNEANNADFPTLYNSYNRLGYELDHTSIYEWIETRVPGGHRSRLGTALDVAYNTEYGALTTNQSALNLVYLLGFQPDTTSPSSFPIYGTSDERFHLVGGNEQLPGAIAASLRGTVQLNTSLTSIALNRDGTYTLTLSSGGRSSATVADQVILALPFSVLRGIDYSRAGFNQVKQTAISQLGYGANGKLHLQFQNRLWNQPGPWGISTGSNYVDTGSQSGWDVTRSQPGSTGILVDYTGVANDGNVGEANADNQADLEWLAQRFLRQIEPVYPGITRQWNGRVTLDYPMTNPYLLGSYSYWKVGQYTQFSGAEREPSGNCHFAGEHCSILFQGFMEGGAEEGQRAADEILAGYGLPVTVAPAGSSPDPGTLYTPPTIS